VVLLALVVLPPLGLLLVWTSTRWRTGTRALVTAPVVVLAGLVLLGVAVPAAGEVSDPVVTVVSRPAAVAALESLGVRDDGGAAGYDRAAFGPAWTDTDRNGCDTRNDVLARDLQDVVVRPGTNGCVVASGVLVDAWSGQTVPFERGRSTIEVDHLVALADAWRSGASAWPYARLLAFANDPLELLAVPRAQNQAKSDADASAWLPEQGVCAFAARQVAVKQKYGLSVTAAERDALGGALASCPDEPLPTSAVPTLAPDRSPAPRPPTPSAAAGEPAAPDHGTCAAAKAAGGGPYVAGRDPEYASYRDPDGDGVTCE
jgi:hypothetical protein